MAIPLLPTIIDVGANAGHPAQVNSDQDEAYLDNEVSGGLAPGAAIDFYVADKPPRTASTTAIPRDDLRQHGGHLQPELRLLRAVSGDYDQCAVRELVAGGGSLTASPSWFPPAIAGSAGCDNDDKAHCSAGSERQRHFHHALQRCRGRHRLLWPAQRRILHLRQQQLQLDQLLPFCPGLYSGVYLERLHHRPTARSAATLRKSTARAPPISSGAPAARATAPSTPPPSATPA